MFFPTLPNPDFVQVFPNGKTDFNNSNGNGKSGPNAAAGWSGEATLDIEWSYAIAPLAHIVLIAVPPAETEGVQGLPNLFKAISDQIDANPGGTVFSMSFGITEQTFGGAAKAQTTKFDAVFQKGIAKGDTFFASSGDDGTLGTLKQKKDTATASVPTAGWPASSPYVTAVGGTQLQDGWAWNPTSDIRSTPTAASTRRTSRRSQAASRTSSGTSRGCPPRPGVARVSSTRARRGRAACYRLRVTIGSSRTSRGTLP